MLRTFALAALLAVSACASTTEQQAATPPEGRDCFNSAIVSGFNYIDEHHIKLSAGPGRDYILTTNFNARDLNWTEALAIRSTTGWICAGDGLGVEIIGGRPPRHYPVSGVERAPSETPEPVGS